MRSADIAQHTNSFTNLMLQIVNALKDRFFIETLRRRTGGLQLARPAADISMGEVFRIFEGRIAFAECFNPATNTCPWPSTCRLREFLFSAVKAFFYELDRVTLADLCADERCLSALLSFHRSRNPICIVQDASFMPT